MDDMQNQMNAILNDPEMMGKIMQMAQSLNTNQQPSTLQTDRDNGGFSMPDIDISTLQKLSGLAGRSGIDKNQQTLLSALVPYLSRERISKLEKAMRAARMANMASSFLGTAGFPGSIGR